MAIDHARVIEIENVIVTLKEFRQSSIVLSSSDEKSISAELSECFRDDFHLDRLAGVAPHGRRRWASGFRVYRHLGVVLGTVDRQGLARLRQHPDVDTVRSAPRISLIQPAASVAIPSTPLAGPTWGIRRLRADQLWQQGFTGSGVLVAHLDTGIDGSHPALQAALQHFAEFDAVGDIVQQAIPRDSGLHETQTAGIIAGREFNGVQFGVAPGAQLACGLVVEGGDVIRRILGGMDWAVGAGACILNMSLGLQGYHDSFQPLMQVLRKRGVLPVIAIGNEGFRTSRSPGNYDEVLSVGACTPQDTVAEFSSSQRISQPAPRYVPSLVAPGVDILSAHPGGGFGIESGTSMAAPHVAGLAALLWQACPAASVTDIEAAILASCSRPSTIEEDRGNRGIPDALEAYEFLLRQFS